ncbi:hypothetical protein CEXT_6861 [Caerostris extrusa]|uniref:Uncharacterized protein n=1 Tax=Caerostris extrusa TaxID=172846 RepID=A0AAV4V8N9_CAEEX|nr:hypothetical protein CEXT_6861 [Caerostris extrusa]
MDGTSISLKAQRKSLRVVWGALKLVAPPPLEKSSLLPINHGSSSHHEKKDQSGKKTGHYVKVMAANTEGGKVKGLTYLHKIPTPTLSSPYTRVLLCHVLNISSTINSETVEKCIELFFYLDSFQA